LARRDQCATLSNHAKWVCQGGLLARPLARKPLPRSERVSELGAAYRNRTNDLRITRVFSCVARGFKARASFMFAGGCRWRSLAVDGSSGASRGHAPVVRRPGSRRGGAVERPSAFQAGHIPSWRGSRERYALPPVAAGSRWLLLLLSTADPVPRLRGLPGAVTAPCPAQAPPPNPTAAESEPSSGGFGGRTPTFPQGRRFWRRCPFGALPFVVLMTDGNRGSLPGCLAGIRRRWRSRP
jgi:hypothetical protein